MNETAAQQRPVDEVLGAAQAAFDERALHPPARRSALLRSQRRGPGSRR